jgi:hypothetical protein
MAHVVTSVRVDFICTGRDRAQGIDTHGGRKLLGQADVSDDGADVFRSRGPSLDRGGRGRPRRSNLFAKTEPETGRDYANWRMMCPSCPLHVDWHRDRAEKIARGAADEARRNGRHVHVFDLSMIM